MCPDSNDLIFIRSQKLAAASRQMRHNNWGKKNPKHDSAAVAQHQRSHNAARFQSSTVSLITSVRFFFSFFFSFLLLLQQWPVSSPPPVAPPLSSPDSGTATRSGFDRAFDCIFQSPNGARCIIFPNCGKSGPPRLKGVLAAARLWYFTSTQTPPVPEKNSFVFSFFL